MRYFLSKFIAVTHVADLSLIDRLPGFNGPFGGDAFASDRSLLPSAGFRDTIYGILDCLEGRGDARSVFAVGEAA